MASGSRSGGGGSGARGSSRARAAEAPSAEEAALLAPQPQLNPILVAMPAAELVAHLNRYRRTADFGDAVLVLASRERRLAEAEVLLRECSECIVKADARIRRDAETEAALRAQIRTLQRGVATLISGISGPGLTQQATVHSRETVPQEDFVAAMSAQGEIGGDVPMRMRHAPLMWSRPAPHLGVGAPLMRHGALSRAAPHLLAAPLPDTPIVDNERAAEQVAIEVLSTNKEVQGEREVPEDVLRARVTANRRKVSQEDAQGEDAAASSHRHSQGDQQAARATKKARSHEGEGTCFYNNVFHALKEIKDELLKKREDESLAKEAAAAAASKQPSKPAAVEEDSSDDDSQI